MREVLRAGCAGVMTATVVGCSSAPSAPQEHARAVTSALVGVTNPTPAMGWNSFDVLSSTRAGYGQTWLNESHIEGASDALAEFIQSAGYQYVNIDSGWSSNYAWTSNS